MNTQEALCIMQLSDQKIINKDIIKQSYRKLSSKYHPDKNPNGLKLMQDLNIANDYLKNVSDGELRSISEQRTYEKKFKAKENTSRNQCFKMFEELGLKIKIGNPGGKTWVSGYTFDHKELLKKFGFRWSPDDKAWWRYE